MDPTNPKKIKAKRYKGLLEWICDREGHEFLVEVDRSYIRNPMNHTGLMKKFFVMMLFCVFMLFLVDVMILRFCRLSILICLRRKSRFLLGVM